MQNSILNTPHRMKIKKNLKGVMRNPFIHNNYYKPYNNEEFINTCLHMIYKEDSLFEETYD